MHDNFALTNLQIRLRQERLEVLAAPRARLSFREAHPTLAGWLTSFSSRAALAALTQRAVTRRAAARRPRPVQGRGAATIARSTAVRDAGTASSAPRPSSTARTPSVAVSSSVHG